ncbi:trichome birefringence-like [Thalictrum thalictroides]|uniref:Trichome birefringence-like n=1 Tax=Thalictrum thalictroides TaxID=46969 RepID=A0A7J6UU27_THATH|nr:trichome birefringence-like [Thalictrum thalictroides]
MKLHSVDLPYGKNQNLKNTTKVVLLIGLAILFTTVPLYYPLLTYPVLITRSLSRSSSLSSVLPPSSSSYDVLKDQVTDTIRVGVTKKCDIFTGEWIPNPGAPYYTNTTCWAIHEHQNCMKYGRPDTDFMKWRWKPNDCELPIFDPSQFLELVRGKSLAFVGDSVARNQMQSLICLLSRVSFHLSNICYYA